jgi:hypothetical protein
MPATRCRLRITLRVCPGIRVPWCAAAATPRIRSGTWTHLFSQALKPPYPLTPRGAFASRRGWVTSDGRSCRACPLLSCERTYVRIVFGIVSLIVSDTKPNCRIHTTPGKAVRV